MGRPTYATVGDSTIDGCGEGGVRMGGRLEWRDQRESVGASRGSLQAWGEGVVCDIVVIEDIKVEAGQLCRGSLAASLEL